MPARSQAAQTLAQRALMDTRCGARLAWRSGRRSRYKPEIVDIKLPQIPSGVPATLVAAPSGYRRRATGYDRGQCNYTRVPILPNTH